MSPSRRTRRNRKGNKILIPRQPPSAPAPNLVHFIQYKCKVTVPVLGWATEFDGEIYGPPVASPGTTLDGFICSVRCEEVR